MTEEIVVSTGAQPGTFDAMETAKPDEPVFTLQGGDPFAPATVLHWVGLARAAGVAEMQEGESTKLLVKATTAEQVAWAMRDYQRGHVEPPAPEKATVELPDRVTEDRNALLQHAATRIYNSVAEMAAVADAIEATGENEAAADIREAVARLNGAAAFIEPRRQIRGA